MSLLPLLMNIIPPNPFGHPGLIQVGPHQQAQAYAHTPSGTTTGSGTTMSFWSPGDGFFAHASVTSDGRRYRDYVIDVPDDYGCGGAADDDDDVFAFQRPCKRRCTHEVRRQAEAVARAALAGHTPAVAAAAAAAFTAAAQKAGQALARAAAQVAAEAAQVEAAEAAAKAAKAQAEAAEAAKAEAEAEAAKAEAEAAKAEAEAATAEGAAAEAAAAAAKTAKAAPPESGVGCRAGAQTVTYLDILFTVSPLMSVADLCSLAQVNKRYYQVFSSEETWAQYAQMHGICKADEAQSWKWNVMAAKTGIVTTKPIVEVPCVAGNYVIVDPLRVFFTADPERHAEFREILDKERYTNLEVTYRGVTTALFRTYYGADESAYEVVRLNRYAPVTADITNSGWVGVMPDHFYTMLKLENAQPELSHGVHVRGLDGYIYSSHDGDFYISHRANLGNLNTLPGIPINIGLGQTDHADVLCTTGGRWTMYSDEEGDSDDEDYSDLTGDRLMDVLKDMSESDVEEVHRVMKDAGVL